MTLVEVLSALLDLVGDVPPSAPQIEARFADAATVRTTAGPNLDHPTWARTVNDATDVYLTLDDDVAGIQAWDDFRGWGAYAAISVTAGTLADVESVVGLTEPMARAADDFSSGDKVAAYVRRSGWTVRVFVELTKDRGGVRLVTVSFPSRDATRTPGPDTTPAAPAAPRPAAGAGEADRRRARTPGRCPNCDAETGERRSFCPSCGAYLDW